VHSHLFKGYGHSSSGFPRICLDSAKRCKHYNCLFTSVRPSIRPSFLLTVFVSLSLSLSVARALSFSFSRSARRRTCLAHPPDEFRRVERQGGKAGRKGREERPLPGGDDSPSQPRVESRESRVESRESRWTRVHELIRRKQRSLRDSIPPFCIPRTLFFRGEQGRLLTPREIARELSCLLPTLYCSRISKYGTIKSPGLYADPPARPSSSSSAAHRSTRARGFRTFVEAESNQRLAPR
jgi:hypothetical protein